MGENYTLKVISQIWTSKEVMKINKNSQCKTNIIQQKRLRLHEKHNKSYKEKENG